MYIDPAYYHLGDCAVSTRNAGRRCVTMIVRTPGGLEYNDKGYLMSPKPENRISMALAIVGPFLIIWNKWNVFYPAFLLQRTSLFDIITSRHLISGDQVATTELLLA